MNLFTKDQEILSVIETEKLRQQNEIQLIASENFASKQVMAVQSSVLTNKYAEGYPGRRYYNGCENVDKVENLAIERLKKLFDCKFANVQPHSGSQANGAVFLALLQPGDTIVGMSLNSGGHLTHGTSVTMSGKWFNAINYDVDPQTEQLDYDEIEKLAIKNKPKLLIAGYSAFPRLLDWKRFRQIADQVGAFLLIDMAHIAGLIAAGLVENPLPYADVVTSTTHKTLRGPRGGIILSNNEKLFKKLNSAVFPGMQGGPLMHIIAAKAICFFEALQPAYKTYMQQVLKNVKAMENIFKKNGIEMASGGSDNHMLIVKLLKQKITGHDLTNFMQEIHIISNKNMIPGDPLPPMKTSGIRIGSAACTTLGYMEEDFQEVAEIISEAVFAIAKENQENKKTELQQRSQKILEKFKNNAWQN